MPRHAKGARLYLREARADRSAEAVWVIRDGPAEISTGCARGGLRQAEERLASYIASRYESQRPSTGDPSEVLIVDVLALYAREKAPTQADPASVKGWIKHLSAFWGESTCADVRRSNCLAYVKARTTQPRRAAKSEAARAVMVTPQTARRELETLSAALGWWDRERPFTRRPIVTLPDKPDSPRDALTRSQAAALLWAALGWRKQPDGSWRRLQASSRANRAHVRRFILIGLYTGTRPGVMPKLLWHESPTSAWVDLEAGIIYRRGKAEKDSRTKRRPLVRVPARLLAHMERWRRLDVEKSHSQDLPITSVLHHGGRPIDGRIRRAFASCVRDAGLPLDITPHWMRHTAATWLVEADVKPWDAAAYLGMTTATLEKCYGHHRPTHQNSARTALSGRQTGGISGGRILGSGGKP